MPRKPEPLEPWMLDAIELIVHRQLSLRQAAQQLGVDITPQQADNISGRIRRQDDGEPRLLYLLYRISAPLDDLGCFGYIGFAFHSR